MFNFRQNIAIFYSTTNYKKVFSDFFEGLLISTEVHLEVDSSLEGVEVAGQGHHPGVGRLGIQAVVGREHNLGNLVAGDNPVDMERKLEQGRDMVGKALASHPEQGTEHWVEPHRTGWAHPEFPRGELCLLLLREPLSTGWVLRHMGLVQNLVPLRTDLELFRRLEPRRKDLVLWQRLVPRHMGLVQLRRVVAAWLEDRSFGVASMARRVLQ